MWSVDWAAEGRENLPLRLSSAPAFGPAKAARCRWGTTLERLDGAALAALTHCPRRLAGTFFKRISNWVRRLLAGRVSEDASQGMAVHGFLQPPFFMPPFRSAKEWTSSCFFAEAALHHLVEHARGYTDEEACKQPHEEI